MKKENVIIYLIYVAIISSLSILYYMQTTRIAEAKEQFEVGKNIQCKDIIVSKKLGFVYNSKKEMMENTLTNKRILVKHCKKIEE